MYARLRGVAEVAIPDVIDKMIDGLLLKEHADKQAGDLRYVCFEGNIFYPTYFPPKTLYPPWIILPQTLLREYRYTTFPPKTMSP